MAGPGLRRVKEIYILVFIFILALSLRLIYLTEVNRTPLSHLAAIGLDDAFYHQKAKEIAQGDWLGKGPFYGMPVYPYFLGLVYKVFGPQIAAAKIIQFILGSFSCILIYLIAKKVFGQTPALISAALACVYGPFIFYEEILVAESLTIFLYLLTFLTLLWALDGPGAKRFFIFGLLTGLSALSKMSILLFIPVVIVLLILRYRPLKTALLYGCCIGLGLVLVISPVTWRNYLVCKDFIPLVSHGGINFFIGNNADASGTFRTPRQLGAGQQDLLTNSKIVAEKLKGEKLKPSQVSEFWFSQGMNFIKTNPQKFISLLGRKLLLFINFYEIPDVRDYYFARLYSQILKVLLGFCIVFTFGMLGIVLSRALDIKLLLLKLFILSYMISVILFFVNSRYRLPAVPFLVILAGSGIYQYAKIVKQGSFKKAIVYLLPLIIVVGLGNMQLVPREDFSGSYNIIGQYHLERSAYQKAIAQFKKAVELNPQMDVAYYNMGKAFMGLGQIKSALENFERALEINPYLYAAYNDRGNIYLSNNQLDKAYEQFIRALEINPDYAQAHGNLGLVYKKKKLWSAAIKEYERALALDSSLTPEIDNNLGLVYLDKGELERASAYFEQAIQLNPKLACAYYNLGLVWAKKGELDQAKNLWEKALEVDPGFVQAQEELKNLKKSLD